MRFHHRPLSFRAFRPRRPASLPATWLVLLLGACSSPAPQRTLPPEPPRVQATRAAQAPHADRPVAGGAAPCVEQACTFSGRLTVRVDTLESASDPTAQPANAFAARFDLAGTPQAGTLQISTPLGTTLAQAEWVGDHATWTDADGHRREDSLDVLTRQTLGAPLPLASLLAWLSGQPDPLAPSQPLPVGPGFTQHGWQIDLLRHAQGQIAISREWPNRIAVRVRLDAPAALQR